MSGRYKETRCRDCGATLRYKAAATNAIVRVPATQHPRCPGPWVVLTALDDKQGQS